MLFISKFYLRRIPPVEISIGFFSEKFPVDCHGDSSREHLMELFLKEIYLSIGGIFPGKVLFIVYDSWGNFRLHFQVVSHEEGEDYNADIFIFPDWETTYTSPTFLFAFGTWKIGRNSIQVYWTERSCGENYIQRKRLGHRSKYLLFQKPFICLFFPPEKRNGSDPHPTLHHNFYFFFSSISSNLITTYTGTKIASTWVTVLAWQSIPSSACMFVHAFHSPHSIAARLSRSC